MRIVIIEFMSLDGVVQAPGGPDEDTDGELRTLELVSTVTSGTGVRVCTYGPVAEG